MKILGRADLSFGGDDVSRFLPWLIAFMVYLAVLAVAGAFALNQVAKNWNRGIANSMTVQIPAVDNPQRRDRQLQRAAAAIRGLDGVIEVRTVEGAEIRRQLEPWLGAAIRSSELPLPGVLNVRIDRGSGLDSQAIAQRLAAVAPGAAVDDHQIWIDGVVRAVRSTEILAASILILIAFATIGTIVFTTRAGLGLHREAIELLHLVGAQDSYVAAQFARRAFLLGLRGSLIGIALSVPTLWLANFLMNRLDVGLIPDLRLGAAGWSVIALLVPAVALIAMTTARLTVMKTLTRTV